MAPPVVTSESCVFNKIGEGFWCPERFTLLDDVPCFSPALACDHLYGAFEVKGFSLRNCSNVYPYV